MSLHDRTRITRRHPLEPRPHRRSAALFTQHPPGNVRGTLYESASRTVEAAYLTSEASDLVRMHTEARHADGEDYTAPKGCASCNPSGTTDPNCPQWAWVRRMLNRDRPHGNAHHPGRRSRSRAYPGLPKPGPGRTRSSPDGAYACDVQCPYYHHDIPAEEYAMPSTLAPDRTDDDTISEPVKVDQDETDVEPVDS